MFKLLAPAKVNLALEVLGRRPDGFHDIKSIVQTVDLVDELHFEPGGNLDVSADMPGWDAGKSLVSKAAKLLSERCGCLAAGRVRVTKRIPLMSGLGGDSSDGAAALKGFNRLWGLGLSDPELMEIGAALGSDVPFFFCGGTALIEGRGELVCPLRAFPPSWTVILVPPAEPDSGKTARLYGSLKKENFSDGTRVEEFAGALIENREPPASIYGNAFEKVALRLRPDLEEYRWQLLSAGAGRVHLSGAGPALFSLHRDRSEAERVFNNLQGSGQRFLARTIGHLD